MSKFWEAIKKSFSGHKFETADIEDLRRQFYVNARYNNTIFDNSTMRTSAFGRYYCPHCCPPNHSIFVEYKLTIGNEKHRTTIIEDFLKRHTAPSIDYIIPETLQRVTSRRGVVTKRNLETL